MIRQRAKTIKNMALSTANTLTQVRLTSSIIRSAVLAITVLMSGLLTSCNPTSDEVAPQAVAAPVVEAVAARVSVQIDANAVHVRTFGAKGDGQADDTEAIRKALKASMGKQLLFGAGTYKLTQVIKLEVSNVELVGVGEARLVTTERTIFDLGSVTNVAFANLTFESSSRDESTYYFGLVSGNRKAIKGLSFTGCTFTAPYGATSGIKLVTDAVGASVSDLRVNNCTFANLGNMGIEIQNHLTDGVVRFSNIEVRNSVFRNLGLNENSAYHHGMAVSLSGKGNEVVIANNTISNPYDLGIELAGAVKNAQILQNVFTALNRTNVEGNRPTAIIAISSLKGDFHENVTISGNQNTGANDNAYLFLGNMLRSTIENNTFNTSLFVQIRNVSDSNFNNNRITSRGTCAVSIESTSFNCQNNTFINSTISCEQSKSATAIVKFTGAKTSRNVISNSQLNRKGTSAKFMHESESATGNILKDCTLANK